MTWIFPMSFDGSLVEIDVESHGIPITFLSNSMEFPWKIHVILLGFDVIHPCHFPIILTAFGHEFLFKKLQKKSLGEIRTYDLPDLESETLPLGQRAIFEREENNSRTYSPKSSKIKNSKNNNSMRRDRFKEDFLFEANSKWNLFIFTHQKYRK